MTNTPNTEKKESKTPERIKTAIDDIFKLIESKDFIPLVTKIVFEGVRGKSYKKPMDAWSLFNLLMQYSNYKRTHPEFANADFGELLEKIDFRGFKQWQKVGRHVKEGESSYSAVCFPMFHKKNQKFYTDQNGQKHVLRKEEKPPEPYEEEEEEIQFLTNFGLRAVFEASQTIGEPLPVVESDKAIEAEKKRREELVNKFNFMPVAHFLNITVFPSTFKGGYYGAYSPWSKTIELCTPDESTFYHELSHAVDDYLLKQARGYGLQGGQRVDQEVVAQFSASVLAHAVGKEYEKTDRYTKHYLQGYIQGDIHKGVMEVINRIEAVCSFILNFGEDESPSRKAENETGEPKDPTEEAADKAGKAAKAGKKADDVKPPEKRGRGRPRKSETVKKLKKNVNQLKPEAEPKPREGSEKIPDDKFIKAHSVTKYSDFSGVYRKIIYTVNTKSNTVSFIWKLDKNELSSIPGFYQELPDYVLSPFVRILPKDELIEHLKHHIDIFYRGIESLTGFNTNLSPDELARATKTGKYAKSKKQYVKTGKEPAKTKKEPANTKKEPDKYEVRKTREGFSFDYGMNTYQFQRADFNEFGEVKLFKKLDDKEHFINMSLTREELPIPEAPKRIIKLSGNVGKIRYESKYSKADDCYYVTFYSSEGRKLDTIEFFKNSFSEEAIQHEIKMNSKFDYYIEH